MVLESGFYDRKLLGGMRDSRGTSKTPADASSGFADGWLTTLTWLPHLGDQQISPDDSSVECGTGNP